MADAPLERPRRAPPRRDASSPAPAPSQAEATEPPPQTTPLEELRRELPAVLTAFREEIRAAAAGTGAQALAKLTASLDARIRSIDARLEEAARETQRVVKLMEEVLDSAVELAEQTARQYREGNQAILDKLEEVVQRAERQVGEITARGEAQSKRIGATAQELVTEARREGRRLGWRPWTMAAMVAVLTIVLVTLLRPGWTMSREQRRALRVGEAVIYTYGTAKEPERVEMRRVMRWRAPEQPDSTDAPLIPPRR